MEFKEIVEKRRSVNFFDTERNISDELIRELVGMASKTPSSFNLQPWSIMVLRDHRLFFQDYRMTDHGLRENIQDKSFILLHRNKLFKLQLSI